MKTKLLLLSLVCFSILFLTNCKKDEDNQEQTTQTTTTPKKVIPETYAKKWVVNTKSGIVFQWIEFTEFGLYFISFDDYSYKSGTCSYDESSNKIILDNYGYVEIESLDGNVISINVYVNETQETIGLVATEGKELPASSQTTLLCKTWDIIEYSITDESTGETIPIYPSPAIDYSRYDVAFTSYGTYFTTSVYNVQGMESGLYENRYWKWSNSSENSICYGTNKETSDNCDYTCGISINEDILIMEGTTQSMGMTYSFNLKCKVAE